MYDVSLALKALVWPERAVLVDTASNVSGFTNKKVMIIIPVRFNTPEVLISYILCSENRFN